ncbi:MAG: 4Fe-4S dicluster domain-containing protein [Ruminococcaceae bacterium]|nr:4Fe-4S dicluster domain-containing protein [Oscillospiraceae bacterium]
MKYFDYRAPDGDPKKNAKVSAVGFGGMRFPVKEDKSIDFEAASALIDRAYEAGINYYDTAYPYHGGTSETFFAEALKKYPRDSYYLADKLPIWLLESADDVERIFNEQLERCNTDHFDFYLCHAMSAKRLEALEQFSVLETLEKLRSEGKIVRLGFSFHDTPEALDKVLSAHKWDFAQIQYNYLDYTMQDAKGQEEVLNRHGVPFLIMEPVRGGALVNVPEKAAKLLSESGEGSVPSYAMRFALSANGVFCALSGMKDSLALEDNIKTCTDFSTVSEDERKLLAKVADIIIAARLVPCTECRYCDGCPSGIDIPALLKLYNGFMTTEDKKTLRAEVDKLSARPVSCISCGACTSVCPQHIDIPATMQTLAKLTEKRQ